MPTINKDYQDLIDGAIMMYKKLMSRLSLESLFDGTEDTDIVKMKYITSVLKRVTCKEVKDILKLEVILKGNKEEDIKYGNKLL